jgi:Matrixin
MAKYNRISGLAMIVVMSLCSLSFSAVRGGGEAGNGGDNPPPDAGVAWFLGKDHVVRVCYELADDFGADKATVEEVITSAFSTWRNYITIKQVFDDTDLSEYQPAMQEKIISCDGSEDIKFELGISNAQIKLDSAQYYKPTAFAQRSSYDSKKGWGKGYIWVASAKSSTGFDWSRKFPLHGILLHELGHVFGCEHVENTIMSPKITDLIDHAIQGFESAPQSTMYHIDGRSELILSGGAFEGNALGVSFQPAYQAFSGQAAQGVVHSKLSINDGSALLILDDGHAPLMIPLHEKLALGGPYSALTAFAVMKSIPDLDGAFTSSFVTAAISTTAIWTATAPSGKKLDVIVQRNQQAPTRILLLGDHPAIVFQNDYPW